MTEASNVGSMQWHEAIASKICDLMQIPALRDGQGDVSYRNMAAFALDVAEHFWQVRGDTHTALFWSEISEACSSRAMEQDKAVVDSLERLLSL